MMVEYAGEKMRPKDLSAKLGDEHAKCRACGDTYVGIATVCNTCSPGYEQCRRDVVAFLKSRDLSGLELTPTELAAEVGCGDADGFASKGVK
jgi:hypothetical protein